MELKDVKLVKGMSRDEVNEIIFNYIELEDEVYLGNNHKHNWKCKCGNIIKYRIWSNIKLKELIKCKECKHIEVEQRYKQEVEKEGDYEYIRSFRKGDILPNGKVVKRSPCIQIKHLYCGSVYELTADSFINAGNKCGKCCQTYEKSFAYHIEVELGESLDMYWDFDKNTVNPHHISKNMNNPKVWIKCTKTNYHGSYEISCGHFVSGKRCSYCSCGSEKTHLHDSFGYKHFDKVCMNWHPDNKVSPFKVRSSSNNKFKFVCNNCNHVWSSVLSAISKGSWCPSCASSKGEKRIEKYLKENNITYTPQKEYDDLIGLGGGNLSYDFYLSQYNILVEYDGELHYKQTTLGNDLKKQKEHDKRKNDYAKNDNIKLLRIPYWEYDDIESILSKELCVYANIS